MLSPRMAYFEYCKEYKKPFVAYRLPNTQQHTTLIFSKECVKSFTDYKEIATSTGFVFTPFDIDKEKNYFIYPDEILKDDKGFRGDLFLDKNKEKHHSMWTKNAEDKATYKKQFEKMWHLLQKGELQKVILSRTLTITDFPEEEHSYIYHKLTESYPQAMVYWVHLPHLGIEWIGATPELLIKQKDDTLHSLALAGSKKNYESWTDKERKEQQLVADYIAEQLSDFQPKKSTTQTLDTGVIQHLATYFTIRKDEAQLFPIVKKLHPTPAIGGLPKNKAIQTILNTEQHNRKYYCGFFGPINIDSCTELFVNLRCMELSNNAARLYVGGGLTKDSNLEREWQETERKADTLRKLLL